MKTLILFDLDGTLLDSLGDLTDSTNYTLAQYGCPARSMDEIRSRIEDKLIEKLRQLVEDHDEKSEDADATEPAEEESAEA